MIRRLGPPSLLTLAFFAVVAMTQASIQIFRSRSVIQSALDSKQFTVTRSLPAKRGAILTSDFKPLAENTAGWELCVNFAKAPHSRAFFSDLAAASGVPESDFERMSDSTKPESWPHTLASQEVEAVEKVKTRWRADGVSVAPWPSRTYTYGPDAAAVTGTMNKGFVARGLEGEYDNVLSGTPGTKVGLVDRTGTFEPARLDGQSTPKRDGQDIVTTIDGELESLCAEAISEAVKDHEATSGSIVIMDPHTGDVLALVSAPTFDPAHPTRKVTGTRTSGLMAPYMSVVEPGSMLKTLTLAKALDDGKVKPTDHYFCSGELDLGNGQRVRCAQEHGHRAHGQLDPEKVIAVSCNVTAARWAMAIGHDQFIAYLDKLGLFVPAGLGLPGELHGFINRNDYARKLQTANLGFGQSLTSTPIALADAFSSLGNDGVRMKPRLVLSIGGKPQPTISAGRMMSSHAASTVMGYMQDVFDKDYGTGHKLQLPGYLLSGKTGTAQKNNSGHGYVSNFVGFVPSVNPRAMILVMIDDPHKGYYGAEVAGPVWKKIAEGVIRRYQIAPDRTSP